MLLRCRLLKGLVTIFMFGKQQSVNKFLFSSSFQTGPLSSSLIGLFFCFFLNNLANVFYCLFFGLVIESATEECVEGFFSIQKTDLK